MLGYLNAGHRVSADGWLETGDLAEESQDAESGGHWIRILGRETDLISVGGRKVSPAEVEEFLLGLTGVVDVLVCGTPNPLLGQSVKALFRLEHPEDPALFRDRVRRHCSGRLEPHKIPSIMEIAESEILGRRQKKIRFQA
jgi:acyl-CoA synthetase (AMP-forming)/AMP-acid ligase II